MNLICGSIVVYVEVKIKGVSGSKLLVKYPLESTYPEYNIKSFNN
jgi:hypothetical protein